ncbi:MAG: hypothetical protein QXH91_03345 [Candidatus Bathyarchaeia archaeon]
MERYDIFIDYNRKEAFYLSEDEENLERLQRLRVDEIQSRLLPRRMCEFVGLYKTRFVLVRTYKVSRSHLDARILYHSIWSSMVQNVLTDIFVELEEDSLRIESFIPELGSTTYLYGRVIFNWQHCY